MKFTIDDIIKIVESEDLLLEVDFKALNPDELLTSQGVDSLDVASILFGIENHYHIKIDNESVANGEWKTINKILANMDKLIK